MGGKSSPPAPDYQAAAQTQAQSSMDVTNQQTYANRPDISTPFGTQGWTTQAVTDPATGQQVTKWVQTTNLTPDSQKALAAQQKIGSEQSSLAQTLLDQEAQQEKTPIDFSKMIQIGAAPGSGDQYYQQGADAAMKAWEGYNLPLQQQATSQLQTQLLNQGLKPGDQAYDTAMTNLQNQQAQERQQATYAAVQEGSQMGVNQHAMDLANTQYNAQASQAQLAQAMQQRGFTLNQIQAILSGNQVGLPATPGFASAGGAQPLQALQAAQSQYGAASDAASASNAGASGLESGIGTIGMAAAVFF